MGAHGEAFMKAWELEKFGQEKNLRLVERPVPVPGPGEVLVRVHAVSLNYRDKVLVEGIYMPSLQLPFVPASDACGEVTAVGAGVTRVAAGDRVIGQFRVRWIDGKPGADEVALSLGGPLPGVLAEYVLWPQQAVVKAPKHLSYEEAATLPIAGLTAWFALVEDGRLKAGESVLVQGTGGVSLFAVQFAAMAGARVIVTSSSNQKLAKAKQLGATDTVNYRTTPDWDRNVLELTGGQGVDHVIEVGGGETFKRSLNALAIDGHVAVVGFLGGMKITLDATSLIRKRARVQGIAVGHRRAFEEMNRAIEIHGLRPVIDRCFPFTGVREAFDYLDQGAFGKIVIRVFE
jgi:NADPH:quinone reductase-like Zn-dependent oxidoreductase